MTSWNCFRGADVSHGLSLLSPLRSDLITLQECRWPAIDSASVIWRGTDPRQGVAVVSTEATPPSGRTSVRFPGVVGPLVSSGDESRQSTEPGASPGGPQRRGGRLSRGHARLVKARRAIGGVVAVSVTVSRKKYG